MGGVIDLYCSHTIEETDTMNSGNTPGEEE